MKIDYQNWIGQTFDGYGIIPMQDINKSQGAIGLSIGNIEYELTCIEKDSKHEEEVYVLEIHPDWCESYEEVEVQEKIQAVHIVTETQQYYEKDICVQTDHVLRAIVIETELSMYAFEKDDVSFSEMIRIEKGNHVLSKYPHSNLWLEEEAFYGMDDFYVKCSQNIESFEKKELIFSIRGKGYTMVQEFLKQHKHCNDFKYVFTKDKVCVECTCKEKIILNIKDCQ
ncbi:MAG: hypothetical protein KBT48_03100 [Firmicutes bacterium]|nr:hypothetical protein [Bacillota bacterium]